MNCTARLTAAPFAGGRTVGSSANDPCAPTTSAVVSGGWPPSGVIVSVIAPVRVVMMVSVPELVFGPCGVCWDVAKRTVEPLDAIAALVADIDPPSASNVVKVSAMPMRIWKSSAGAGAARAGAPWIKSRRMDAESVPLRRRSSDAFRSPAPTRAREV